MARIYRAQSIKYEYLIPTALRCHNFLWLVQNIKVTNGIPLDIVPRAQENFSNPDNSSIKAYYLSVRNILETICRNPIFKNFVCFEPELHSLFKDFHSGKDFGFEETITEFDRIFMNLAPNLSSFVYLQNGGCEKLPFLKLSHHFQHLNLNFEELLYIDKPPYEENQICDKKREAFPTMCLDFSDNLDVMRAFNFIKDDSAVYSIETDAIPPFIYDSYLRKCDYKLNGGVLIGKNTNSLMKYQKGYCIYWPWKYTIQELKENQMFGFKVESLPGKVFSLNLNITGTIKAAQE